MITYTLGFFLGRYTERKKGQNNPVIPNHSESSKKDTSFLQKMQKIEDDSHYEMYEIQRLNFDRRQIFDELVLTRCAVAAHPSLSSEITEEDISAVSDEYTVYLNMCEKLKSEYVLSKVEFAVKNKNPLSCRKFRLDIYTKDTFYQIHNEASARYAGGKMSELLKQEFKTKWY